MNRHRKNIAKMYYRRAGENLISDKFMRGVAYFVTSALLQPAYVWNRLTGQILARYDKEALRGSSSLILRDIQVQRGASSPVTVIIACRNTGKFIREAVESCLNQTRPPEKIIVVDDASTDNSSTVLDELAHAGQIQLIRNDTNLGRAASFDRALEFVATEYVAILDADDIALPNRFERQLAFMGERPRLGCCSSFVQYINSPGEKIARGVLDILTEEDLKAYLQGGEPFGLYCPSVTLRAEVIKNPALRFRGQFWPADDIDLWNRIAEAGWQVLAQPEFLTAYRIHAGSTVTVSTRSTRMQFEWVRACLRARRAGQPEPTREKFFETLDEAPALVRFNRWRKTESKVAYRAAGFAFGERHHWKTAICFLKAFCLQPMRVSFRVIQQIFES
jgi:glycosyltransferase involved in cell wall biosynthesis